MADIVIARLIFPNDPTNTLVAHQMFVGTLTGSILQLYSVSSILGKERRVYGPERDNYITILAPEHIQNGFRVPSFIDCAKMYEISLSSTTNISNLSTRNISPALKSRIETKINDLKAKGTHTTYQISETDFKSWNPAL